jgi:ankyrin repeat protein
MPAVRDGHEVIRHEEFLGCAMRTHNRELLDLLLEWDPTVPHRVDFWSVVTYPNAQSLVRKLLARGLDPNRRDWLGKTFLHACAENGARLAAEVFLDAGADINVRDLEYKGTPLASAVRASCEGDADKAALGRQMVEFLVKRGAVTNLPDDEPWATPLAWAIRGGTGEIAEVLLQNGAM